MGVFDMVGAARPPRTKFNLSYTKSFNCDEGQIIPILCEEVVPGDSWKVGNSIVVRFEPTIAPIFTRINVRTYYFFVPYRILDPNWERFITGGKDAADPSAESETGLIQFRNINGASKYSLTDYFGFPLVTSPSYSTPPSLDVLPFPWRAYNKIWNEYFRDENFQDEVNLDQDNVLYANWRKDYFTSALPWQERGGVSPSFNLMGFAPVGVNRDGIGNFFPWDFKPENAPAWMNAHFLGFNAMQSPEYFRNLNGSVSESGFHNYTSSPYEVAYKDFGINIQDSPNLRSGGLRLYDEAIDENRPWGDQYPQTANLPFVTYPTFEGYGPSSAGFSDYLLKTRLTDANAGFNINDLRFSFQVQKWLERSARGGYRYTEFLQAMYGVHPRDDRLQRPEFIGGTSQPVVTSEVLQTSSDASVGGEPQPTGRFVGHNMSFSRGFAGRYYAQEFGIIMGVMIVRPEAQYSQGINKQWLRRTRYDFFNPLFSNLSEQPIESREIYADGTGQLDVGSGDFQVFGYQAIYDEMRVKQNMVVADFRPDDPNDPKYYYDYWTQARFFSERPILNGSFLQCKPDKRIFAVQGSQPELICNVGNLVTAVRPIPYISEPGLIDHH